MHWHYTPYVWPLIISAALSAALGLYAWRQRAASALWTTLGLLAAAVSWYAAGYVVEILAADLPAKTFWAKLQYLGLAPLPSLYLAFALQFAGLGRLLTRRNVAVLAAVPAVTALLAFTNEWHRLIWVQIALQEIGSAVLFVPIRGPAFWAFCAVGYGLMLVAIGLLASAVLQSPRPYRQQGLLILTAILIPVLSNLGYGLGITPVRYLNPTAIAFSLWVALVTVAIVRYGFPDLLPVARQALFDHLPDGVLVLDAAGRVIDLNPALATALQLEAEDVIGQPAGVALASCPAFLACLREGGDAEIEIQLGEGLAERHCIAVGVPMTESDGRLAGRLALLRDVTSLKQLEAQYRQAQKMEIIGRLAGGVAHDFNNLLTAITGCASLARDTLPPDHAGREDMSRILQATERGAQLTRQLLAFARAQEISPRALNLNSLLQGVEEMLPCAIGDDIRLEVAASLELGLVRGDPDQLAQVIANLAINAIDAMPAGGLLTIETANSTIARHQARPDHDLVPGEYVTLAISDTGTGMSGEVQARLFEPFFTTKGPDRGTGLGLATAFGIVKQHGGTIIVASEAGRGSTFTVYLPRLSEEGLEPR